MNGHLLYFISVSFLRQSNMICDNAREDKLHIFFHTRKNLSYKQQQKKINVAYKFKAV